MEYSGNYRSHKCDRTRLAESEKAQQLEISVLCEEPKELGAFQYQNLYFLAFSPGQVHLNQA